MRRHVKASSARTNQACDREGRGLFGWACLCVLGLVAFLGSSAPAASAIDSCPNAVFRTGPSAKLPDCRAYELVSPPFTGGIPPQAGNFFNIADGFETQLLTSTADSVIYNLVGGPLSGFPGTGINDRYRAKRTATGWASEFIGVRGDQSPATLPGGVSPDHEYYFTNVGGRDIELEPNASLQAAFGGEDAEYLHRPDGGFELIGRGSLGEYKDAIGHLITAGASHVLFSAPVKLEPEAPPTGTMTVYDRTPGGSTKVISLLPGDVASVNPAIYMGASADGREVVFANGDSLYVRIDNTATEKVATASLPGEDPPAFAGVFSGHVFYADAPMGEGQEQEPADLYSFETGSKTTTRITDVGDALFVHVSTDGSTVYFISQSEIGGQGTAGQPNLYGWSRTDGTTTFIATVAPSDVAPASLTGEPGLAKWAFAVGPAKEIQRSGLGLALSRTTDDGSSLVFESRAQLTSYDNVEQAPADCGIPKTGGDRCMEIYLYEAATENLLCVSCPANGPATGDAGLQTFAGLLDPLPLTQLQPTANLTDDGETVFFESDVSLVPQDGNDHRDVYRWKKGAGVALISTGQALADSSLYAVSPSGNDVVIVTPQELTPEAEHGSTSALYDARVNGGFPPPESAVTEPCSGDICQGAPNGEPPASPVASASIVGTGNVKNPPRVRCRKGKHKVRLGGKTRCVKSKHRRGGSKPGAAR